MAVPLAKNLLFRVVKNLVSHDPTYNKLLILGSNPDETTTITPSTTATATTTTTKSSEPLELPKPSTKPNKPQKVPTVVFTPPGASNQPKCQCFCQAPADMAFEKPDFMGQNKPNLDQLFQNNPNFAQVFQTPPKFNRPSFAQNQPNFVPARPKTSPRFLTNPLTQNIRNDEPLFVKKSDRRNEIRMAFNFNRENSGSEESEENPLFVKPSEKSRNPVDLGITLFV